MREITITLPLPAKALSPNASGHWAKIAQAKRLARREAWAVAMRAKEGPPMAKASLKPVFYWPDRRRRDDDNAVASLKAARDGLADAGVVVDDRDFTTLPAEFHVDKQNPRVELMIKELQS